VVNDLLVFEPQLLIVANVLPFTASAGAEVFAERRYSYWRLLMNTLCYCLALLFFLVGDAQVHYVAWSHARTAGGIFHKNNALISTYYTFALGCNGIDSNRVQPFGDFMTLSAHTYPKKRLI